MDLIAITGTNGKTTGTYYIRHLLGGKKIGVIGTLGAFAGNKKIEYTPPKLTTPNAAQLTEIFEKMKKSGVKTVIMEASAHGIIQNRLEGLNFRVGVFTNLTQDHLDYFKTFEKYAETKFGFMTGGQIGTAVVCSDDDWGAKIIAKCAETGKACKPFLKGANFIETNINAAVTVALAMGEKYKKIQKRIKTLPVVEGRFEYIRTKKLDKSGVRVVVDFAHTPDGIEKVLDTARCLVTGEGRLITVFGCGGNRDVMKRPIMGKLAVEKSDITVVTSDNPRHEPPMSILYQIEAGIKTAEKPDPVYTLIEDRKTATHFALGLAKRGDLVVICGKGAEQTQEIDGVSYPYNDADVVKEYYNNKINIKRHGALFTNNDAQIVREYYGSKKS